VEDLGQQLREKMDELVYLISGPPVEALSLLLLLFVVVVFVCAPTLYFYLIKRGNTGTGEGKMRNSGG
jgi:hypothetical protein